VSDGAQSPSQDLVVGGVLLGLFGVLAVIVGTAPRLVQGTDDRWLGWMLASRWPPATSVAKVLDVIGGGVVMWTIRGLVAAALAYGRRWRALTVFVLAEVSAEACIGPIKSLIGRARPTGSLVAVSGQAFPSGHVVTASVTAAVLVLLLVQGRTARRWWLAAALGWSMAMALSRTYLASHWLADTIGGILVGIGWALVWTALGTRRTRHREQQVAFAGIGGG
jgi:undecaprenyl-diphosphatase